MSDIISRKNILSGDYLQYLHELILSKVGSPIKGLQLGRQEDAQGPAADASVGGLHKEHELLVHVGSLLPVNLNAGESRIKSLRHLVTNFR